MQQWAELKQRVCWAPCGFAMHCFVRKVPTAQFIVFRSGDSGFDPAEKREQKNRKPWVGSIPGKGVCDSMWTKQKQTDDVCESRHLLKEFLCSVLNGFKANERKKDVEEIKTFTPHQAGWPPFCHAEVNDQRLPSNHTPTRQAMASAHPTIIDESTRLAEKEPNFHN